jgi:uncharacterized protein
MVHGYENNGYKIALDVHSGAVHLVDEMAYRLIPQVEELINSGKREKEQITAFFANLPADDPLKADDGAMRESLNEILDLYEAGQLFSPDSHAGRLEEVKNRETVVKALCLHMAHACNLACRYCFAAENLTRNRQADRQSAPLEPTLMPLDIGKQALDFLVAGSASRRNLEVDFFGGEPLLNWEVIKELVAYGRRLEKKHNKNFRFTLTTNGVLLTEEMFAFINKEISNVVLSIDGRREINDRMRPLHDGSGSYDVIIEKFIKLAASRNQKNYYLRGTFTRENLDFTEDFRHLADLGFKQISLEPMVETKPARLTKPVNEPPGEPASTPPGPQDAFAIRPADIPAVCNEYDRLAAEIIAREKAGQPINFFHFMIDLTGGPCVAKRLSGCGAGSEYLAVTPGGDLYPCHQFVGQPGFLMGSLTEGITNPAVYNAFKSANVYTKPQCRTCFAKFCCSGGCAAAAYKQSENINGCDDLACALQRKRIEAALMIKAALAQ